MPKTLNTYSIGSNKRVLIFLLLAFAVNHSFSQNKIVIENQNPGVPASTWDIPNNFDGTFGDPSIQGFATDISVNIGGTIHFKIDVNTGTNKDFDFTIYRIGFYQGNGARLIAASGP